MLQLNALLGLFAHRAEMLIPMLVVGFFVGEFVARYAGVDAAFAWISRTAQRLVTKLNRPNRSIATRVWRGVVAMLMLLVPALLVGALISSVPPLALLVIIALFGRGFATHRLLQRWRRAHAGTLPLELPEHDFLFADSHAVMRYSILTSAEAFAVGIVGVCFWYLVGGLPASMAYLTLRELSVAYAVPAFGWAATALFGVVNALPRALALLLLALGGLFVPRATPWAMRRHAALHGRIAGLLGISLGGRLPSGELPWAGSGTPKAMPEHLARWMLVRLAATVLGLMLLASPQIYNLLIILI